MGPNTPKKGPDSGLGSALFGSVKQRVLGLLFSNPERTFYVNELLRLTGAGKGAVSRELDRLTEVGILVVQKVGNQKHYKANRATPIFDELHGIVVKTFGVADALRQALVPVADRILAAFIYGSIATGRDTSASDIDLFVISERLGYADLLSALQPAEATLQRKINPNVYSLKELFERRTPFLEKVLERPKIFLIGSEDDLRG